MSTRTHNPRVGRWLAIALAAVALLWLAPSPAHGHSARTIHIDAMPAPALQGGAIADSGVAPVEVVSGLAELSTIIPEPTTLAILGLGGVVLAGGLLRARRRNRD